MLVKVNGVSHLPIPGDPHVIYIDTSTEIQYRWNGSSYSSPNISGSSPALTSSGVGTKSGSTVSVAEQGDGVFHKTILTLTNTPVTFTDDAGVGQFAALKLYDFPAGNIIALGASINANLALNEAWWVDTTDGAVGLGTTANADASTIATTRQNIIAVTAIAAMTAQAGSINAQSAGVGVTAAAGGTDATATLNLMLTDSAAHMPDVVTNGAFTTDATGWTLGAGWAAGTAVVDATLADTALSQNVTLVPGVPYLLTFTTTRSAGSVRPTLGGVQGTARSTAATFTETIIPTEASGLSFTGTGFSGSIDAVTCTPLEGSGVLNGAVTIVWTNAGDF